MRNSGWYIPYWRRSKKKAKADPATNAEDSKRSEEQMELVRQRWIERYRRTVRALRLLGLSMGSTRSEVRERYERLRDEGGIPARDLEEAYRFLMRVMLAQERRKRRARRNETGAETTGAASTSESATAESEDTERPSDEDGDAADDDDEELDEETEDPGFESGLRADDANAG
jgi:hypothetical protein